jgi:hypothetical protein
MQTFRAIVRMLSGSAALAGSTTAMTRGFLELTEAQLEQVAGGGGHPNVGSGGTAIGESGRPPIPK